MIGRTQNKLQISQLKAIKQNGFRFPQFNEYTIVVGGSGSGKSTAINLIMGNQIKYEKKRGGRYDIKLANSMIEGPIIGNTQGICTNQIHSYQNFVDVPALSGHNFKNMENTVAESNLFLMNRSIRLIFVSDVYEITSGKALNFLDNLRHILVRFDSQCLEELCESTILIVTKVNPKGQLGEKDILECLEAITEPDQNKKNHLVKVFLKKLLELQKIFYIHMPDSPQFRNTVDQIQQQLRVLPYTTLTADYPSYANPENQDQLRKDIRNLEDHLKSIFQRSVQTMKLNFQPKDCETTLKHIYSLRSSKQMIKDLDLFENSPERQNVLKSLGLQKEGNQFFTVIEQIDFLDRFVERDQPFTFHQDKAYEFLEEIDRIQKNLEKHYRNEVETSKDRERQQKLQKENQEAFQREMNQRKQIFEKKMSERPKPPKQPHSKPITYLQNTQNKNKIAGSFTYIPQPHYFEQERQTRRMIQQPNSFGFFQGISNFFKDPVQSMKKFFFPNYRGNRRFKKRLYGRQTINLRRRLPDPITIQVNNNYDLEQIESKDTNDIETLRMQVQKLRHIKKQQQMKLQKMKILRDL